MQSNHLKNEQRLLEEEDKNQQYWINLQMQFQKQEAPAIKQMNCSMNQ